jgi:hypothetical protein
VVAAAGSALAGTPPPDQRLAAPAAPPAAAAGSTPTTSNAMGSMCVQSDSHRRSWIGDQMVSSSSSPCSGRSIRQGLGGTPSPRAAGATQASGATMAALVEPPSPSAASVHQAQARASRRRALSLLLPPADISQSRGGPTSLTPTSQPWQGLKRPAAASPAPLLPSHVRSQAPLASVCMYPCRYPQAAVTPAAHLQCNHHIWQQYTHKREICRSQVSLPTCVL